MLLGAWRLPGLEPSAFCCQRKRTAGGLWPQGSASFLQENFPEFWVQCHRRQHLWFAAYIFINFFTLADPCLGGGGGGSTMTKEEFCQELQLKQISAKTLV